MSHIIRNYGGTRDIPYKNGVVTMVQDQVIVTDDPEEINAFKGHPQISIVVQPGTPELPPIIPPEPGPEVPSYQEMSKKALLALCEERGLEVPNKATKAVLIELLIADDEEQAQKEKDDDEQPEQPEEPAEPETGFKVGDRVTTKLDREFYSGTIEKITGDKALVHFDDGDKLLIDLAKLLSAD